MRIRDPEHEKFLLASIQYNATKERNEWWIIQSPIRIIYFVYFSLKFVTMLVECDTIGLEGYGTI